MSEPLGPRELERTARNVAPGAWAVDNQRPIATLLGSCVAVCLWDPKLHLGGLNHFMLPVFGERRNSDMDVLLCGDYSMEALLNAVLGLGARKERLQAKVFGGGAIVSSFAGSPVGERNAAFAREWLEREGIAITATDLLGPWSRKLVFDPRSGDAFCRRTVAQRSLIETEESYGRTLTRTPTGGNVELF